MILQILKPERKKYRETFLKDKPKKKKKRRIRCKFCNSKVTDSSKIISISNSSNHTFVNPAGIVYNITCYSEADGCIVVGEKMSEFSWFNGFFWQFAMCKECLNHLGWFYSSDDKYFFGLVSEYLIEE